MRDNLLFDYQEEMVERVQEAFTHHNSVMVQMPTGTGKTHVLAAIVGLFLERKVWVVAHRRELVSQIKDTLEKFFSARALDSIRVMSVQWLSRHYIEIKEEPGLIVIDEAHHALAETYAEVMNAYPNARKLGLTATPFRLNGKGFGDLFDTLLCSWDMERFIAEGRLSTYDYYSIRPDSADQHLIDSLQKRGADGDYQTKELGEVLDVRPSLERLCQTVSQYVPGKKGIVYAVSIQHAEHIAVFYREHGIRAMAISSKTPLAERKALIGRFKRSSVGCGDFQDAMDVLVSVDLFSEGFDCPDMEFIQLARPTLSLAKYLQMVGRGLRVSPGKDFCVILDNVGLYRRFGLPSSWRDWQGMFEGQNARACALRQASAQIYDSVIHHDRLAFGDDGGDMMRIMRHEVLGWSCHAYQVRADAEGMLGVADRDGQWVPECRFRHVELTEDGFACCYNQRMSQRPWLDLKSGLRFHTRPQAVMLMGIEFCTEDGWHLFPRIRSALIDRQAWLTVKTLELQVGCGLSWGHRFIPWDEPGKVYWLADEVKGCGSRLYRDDAGRHYVQADIEHPLRPVSGQVELTDFQDRCMEDARRWQAAWRNAGARRMNLMSYSQDERNRCFESVTPWGDGLYYISRRPAHTMAGAARQFWLDSLTNTIHYLKPELFRRGFVKMLREGDVFFVRNIKGVEGVPLKNWQVRADDNICVIDDCLFLRERPHSSYLVLRRSSDFSYFLTSPNENDGEGHANQHLQIVQFRDGEVKCTWVTA